MTDMADNTKASPAERAASACLVRPCILWIAAGVIIAVSAVVAGVLTPKIAASRVDIGLDLLEEIPTPQLHWTGGQSRDGMSMQRIAPEYSPVAARVEFEILTNGSKDRRSKGAKVVVDRFVSHIPFESGTIWPPLKWTLTRKVLQTDGLTSATCGYTFKQYLSPSDERTTRSFILKGSSDAGIAVVRTPSWTKLYDLYSDAGGQTDPGITVEIVPTTSAIVRFYGSIPRREYGQAIIAISRDIDTRTISIDRLYVGSFIPQICFRASRRPLHAIGLITENWTPQYEWGALNLPPLPAWERGGVWTFWLVLVLACVLGAALATAITVAVRLARWLLANRPVDRPLAPFRAWVFLGFLAPLLAVWLVFLACFYPGIMSPDSCVQWEQAHGVTKIVDQHPPFHTLTMKALWLVWDSPAAVCLAQILAMSGTLAFGLASLLRARVHWLPVLIALLSAIFSIRNGLMAVVLWKDVAYGVLVLAVTVVLFFMLWSKARESFWSWVILGTLMALLPLYRHNGLAVLVGLAFTLPFFFWRCGRRLWTGVGVAVAGYLLLKTAVYTCFNVEIATSKYWMPANKIARYVSQDVPLAQTEYETVDDLTLLYREPFLFDHLASRGAVWYWIHWPMAKNKVDYEKVVSVFEPLRFAGVRLLSVIHRHKFIYWPPQSKYDGERDGLIETVYPTTSKTHRLGARYGFKCPQTPMPKTRDWLLRQYYRSETDSYAWFAWRGGAHFWLILLSLGILLRRTRDYRLIAIYLPVLLNIAGLLLIDFSQFSRLIFPLTLPTGFLVCLAFLPPAIPQSRIPNPQSAIRNPQSPISICSLRRFLMRSNVASSASLGT